MLFTDESYHPDVTYLELDFGERLKTFRDYDILRFQMSEDKSMKMDVLDTFQ